MDSKTRCNSYKYEVKPDIIIPHHCYSGDLPIEIIISDVKYIKLFYSVVIKKKTYGNV